MTDHSTQATNAESHRDSTVTIGSGSYRIEPLNSSNWLAWKRKMMAILCDLELEDLIVKGIPEPIEAGRPTVAETKVIAEMVKKDAKARTRIELAVGDSEMIHLLGATTAKAMWDQLQTVKETRGRLGILSACQMLFRYSADETAFDMASHITKLRRMQEELHLMGSVVPDDNFVMILLTSLPEAWDNYTSG
jgi:hypothetical protein